jgi:hypothetical protein
MQILSNIKDAIQFMIKEIQDQVNEKFLETIEPYLDKLVKSQEVS